VNLSDLRTALQERREDFSQSSAKLNRRINQAYLDICSRRKWGWLRRIHLAQTFATETYDDVVCTQDWTKVTVPQGSMPTTRLGYKCRPRDRRIEINGHVYRTLRVEDTDVETAAPTAATTREIWWLDQPFIGSSGTYTATVYHDELALPLGAERIVEAIVVSDSRNVSPGGVTVTVGGIGTTGLGSISPADMTMRDLTSTGRPSAYSVVRKEPIPPPLNALSIKESSTYPLGVYTPATGPSPLGARSKYRYWAAHVDIKSGAESALGPEFLVDNTDLGLGVGVLTLDYDPSLYGLAVKLYRSKDGGSTPLHLQVNAAAGGLDRSDTLLPNTVGDVVTSAPLVDSDFSGTGAHDTRPDIDLGNRAPDSASTIYMTLWPAPSTRYQVKVLYQLEAQRLIEDADIPLFDASFHHLVLDGAEALMLEAEDEQSRANQARQRFELGIARMIQNDRLDGDHRVVMGGRTRVAGRPQAWHGSWDGTGP